MKKYKNMILFILLVLFISLVSWTIWGNLTIGTTHYKITSKKIPSAFDHYKIVVLSDIHNANFGNKNATLVEKIAAEKPDIIAITGDLIDSHQTNLTTVKSLVNHLTEIAPCYYVSGNHEAWNPDTYQTLERILQEASIRILHDEIISITKHGESVQLIGLADPDFTDRDPSIQASILETKLKALPINHNYAILLSHRPEHFSVYVDAKIDLVCSGHAHGGQFRLPWIGGLYAPNQGLFPKYDAGRYQEENTTMIVSRGIGNSVIPIRFNNQPEIVSIELRQDHS